MRISPPAKAVIIGLGAGAWVLQADPGLGATVALVAGASLFTFARLRLAARRTRGSAPPAEPLAAGGCSAHRHTTPQHGISRTPTGRGARDVRCPSTRVPTRARRSTRRYQS